MKTFGKEITLSQTTNFRLFQTESLSTTVLNLVKMTDFRLFQTEGVHRRQFLNLMKVEENSPNE